MYKIDYNFSNKDLELLKGAKNIRALKLRVKKVTNIKGIESYIEDLYDDHNEIRCGFCGSIRIFKSYIFKMIDDDVFITDIISDEKFICSRKDTAITKQCKSKTLNSNSKELVKIVYGLKSLEEANDFILSRNSSPFYRTNFKSDEEYRASQRRDEQFYGAKRFQQIKKKMSTNSSKEAMIKKHGIEKFNDICKTKDSSSKMHFQEKYGANWEELFFNKCKQSSTTLHSYIKRYGEIVGEIKYTEMKEKRYLVRNDF